MKKMNKSLKSALAALVVGGLAFSAAAAEGNIYSIDLVNDVVYGGKIPSAEKPLTIGEKAVVRVRLANSNWADPTTPGARPWMVKPTDAYAALGTAMQSIYPLKLGIMLGGQAVYATFVASSSVASPADTYTDLYFSYTVKAGDLAMPALLMSANGEAASSTSSADYFLLNANYWQIVNADGEEAVFHFTTQGDYIQPVPSQPQNYSVSGVGMGLYVKTVDFDSNYVQSADTSAEESVWRRFHQGLTSTSSTQPSVVVNGTPTTDVTMYLWVEDETVAAPLLTDAGVSTVTDSGKDADGNDVTYVRTVLPISFAAGADPTKTFRLKGLKIGQTKVCLSSSENLVFDDMGVLVTNWLERVIEVVEPPEPYASIEVLDRAGVNALAAITASTNYWDYVAVLKLTLNGAEPAKAVTFGIDVSKPDDVCPATGIWRIGISENTSAGDIPWLDHTTSVTFNAGETEKYLYLYALDQTDDIEGKITLTPNLSGDGAATYTGKAHTGSFAISPANPVIFSPQNGEVLSEAIAGEDYPLDLVLGDSYRRLRQEGWKIQLKSAAFGDSKWHSYEDGVSVDPKSGEVSINVTFTIEKENVDLQIRVVDPEDGAAQPQKKTSATVTTKITVTAPKKASATFDRGADPYAESRTETAKVYFQISQPSENAKALYAFLRPLNDDATNKVSSTAFTTSVPNQGVYIGPGELDSGANYAKLALDDGDCSAMYEVVICTTSTYAENKKASYVAGQCTLNVTNVIPAVRSVSMGGNSVKVSGGVMPKSVAQGITKAFTIDVNDPGLKDFEAAGDDAFCVKWTFGGGDAVYMWGDPSTNSISRVFTSPGDVEVTVQCQDKDMRATKTWTDPFTFTVNVLDAPAVSIVQKEDRTSFYEDETSDASSRFYVQLNVAPDFTNATDRLVVDLAVEPNDTSATATYTADDCVLSKTTVEFSSGMTTGPTFYLKSLDGTQDSAGKGFRITAKVRDESAKADAEGKTWIDGEYEINIQNRAPSVMMPTESKDAEGNPITTTTTINATQSVGWSVTDVDADLEGLTVKWETSEGSIMEYVQGTGTDTEKRKYVTDVRSGTHTFFFTGSGAKTVVMTVTDKDGGQASRTLYYTIAASKTMEILPNGPSSGNGTTLSAKYLDKASGRGEGKVWTANAASQIANWVFTFGCGLDNEFRVYAKGYRVGDVDANVDADGNAISATSGAAGYAYPDKVYDSFFYCWLQLTRADGKATLSDEILSISPEHPEQANSGTAVALPKEKDDDGNYSKTILEAIFSREMYATDNMGDINLDGIPDAYVKKYGLGVFDDEGTKTGNDLLKVASYNEDNDVLPAENAEAEERPFTALLEIRGYGTGLNDAPTLAGLGGFKPDRKYTDPAADKDSTLTALEYLAWLDYAAAKGLDATASASWEEWSPERPTDPTTDDTDEDGFSDAFEYFYWYRAHVGYFETRTLYGITITNHVYLTGRCFTPTDPEGTVITSEEIETLMDPLTAWGDQSDAATRDTDNDGLPDYLEFELGTNPFDFDTDKDGLPDGYEVLVSGTDPCKYASDGLTCDAARNLDGDHMAYTTVYRLRQPAEGEPAETREACGEEHAAGIDGFSVSNIPYRCTFAIAATNVGPTVVQWFAAASTGLVQTAESPVTEDITVFEIYDGLSAWEESNSWTRVAVRATSVPLVAVGKIGSFEARRLAADVAADKAFLAEKAEDKETVRRGLPKRLARGSFVRNVTNATGFVELTLTEDILGATNNCNVAWRYGTADGGYGELALGPTQSVAKTSLVLAAPSETRTVALLHSYVYQQYGFDPRTAWSSTKPFNGRDGGLSATPMRTRPYTTYDEYLLMFYYLNSRAIELSDLTPTKSNPWSAIFAKYLTNPRGKDEALTATNAVVSATNSYGDDTDGDGVPDGWELYVMSSSIADPVGGFKIAGPETVYSPTRHFSEFPADEQDPDKDDLNEAEEFAGWSTCVAYSNVTATVTMDTLGTWVNKLLPTNPYNDDTDGDGIGDSEERGAFAYGDPLTTPGLEGSLSVPGGGLNPCSVDTDHDGLPDGWELQFAGTYDEDVSKSVVSTATNGTDVVTTTNTTIVGEFSGGMDGTVSDATLDYDMDGLENWQEYMVGAMRCWRYDDPITPFSIIPKDWYYPLVFAPQLDKFGFEDMNEFYYRTFKDKSHPYYNPHLIFDQASCARYFSHVTNTWDAVYQAKGGAQYMFKHRLDDVTYKDLFELYIMEQKKKDDPEKEVERKSIGTPALYISCDPTKADTDQDGMDDYYELFHGINPLLGAAGAAAKSGAYDVVYVAWGGTGSVSDEAQTAYINYWIKAYAFDLANDPSKISFIPFMDSNGKKVEMPWINGMAEADPDGDDIRNQDEAIMPQVGSTQGYHTDPSPLWMTDINYEGSLTHRFYTMPYREKSSLDGSYSFTWEDKTYSILECFGMFEADLGNGPEPALMDYTLDQWGVDVTYMFSFEQTEGYDTDGDCYGDKDEIGGTFNRSTTDPRDAHSPTRRQAMYFQGPSKPSMLLAPSYSAVVRPDGTTIVNEMAFTQFTIECWACPETADDSTLIERTVSVNWSHPADEDYVRRNFSLQIKDGKWYAYYQTNGTLAGDRVEVFSRGDAATNAWTHVALSYDGAALRLYVNGQEAGKKDSGLRPCNGASSIDLYGKDDIQNEYHADAAKGNFIFSVGASALSSAYSGAGIKSSAYSNFFKGYIDEVRVWDGARSASDIAAEKDTRYTAELAAENRSAVYTEWNLGKRRYIKDANGDDYDVTPELRYHYSFDTLPSGENENAVAKRAHGLGTTGDKAPASRPADYTCYTWDYIVNGYPGAASPFGSVYSDLLWIPWIPNTVAQLPFLTGMTMDSQYWTEDYKGMDRGSYKFPRTAEPYINWVQAKKNMRGDTEGTPAIETRPDFLAGVEGNYKTLFDFDSRHRNLYADALLPLGGAYAKYVPASLGFWDGQGASTVSPLTGRDSDNDGLPDWWELYAEENYRRADMGSGEFIGWNTIVDYNGRAITAGEAYLYDLAHGAYMDAKGNVHISSDEYRQTAVSGGAGIPDWWMEMYGIKGESALDDHDHDGLSNYHEYLLSEVFNFQGVVFDPTVACSVDKNTPDYFYRVGSLYVGEIFTDHDLVDDDWEDNYDTKYASRLVYDAFADADEDGWSNRSENRYAKQCQPIVANNVSHYSGTDGLVSDYPIPTLNVKLRYNGSRRAAVEKSQIVVRVRSEERGAGESTMTDDDAVFVVASDSSGTTTTDGTNADAEEGSGSAYTKTLGKWTARHAVGTLTPGSVNQDSIELQFCADPSALTYRWYYSWEGDQTNGTLTVSNWNFHSGSAKDLADARLKYGDANVILVDKTSEYRELIGYEASLDEQTQILTWTWTKNVLSGKFATFNLITGAYDIDLSLLEGQFVETTNDTGRVSLEDQTYRISYMANPSVGLPRTLYLGEADTGYVREGKNTVVAFADLDGSGTYTAGEPYGVLRGVNVSWRASDLAEIELLETTPLFARYDLVSGDTDREAIWEAKSTGIYDSGSDSGTTEADQRVRVVRYAVDNVSKGSLPANMMAVVLDKTLHATGSGSLWLTEDDILASVVNEFDLDWNAKSFSSEAMNLDELAADIQGTTTAGGLLLLVTNVYYSVVIGNGDIREYVSAATNIMPKMIVRSYDVTRQRPALVAPTGAVGGTGSANDSVVYDAAPTFMWTMNGNNTYTAFKLQVLKDSTVIYDSGYQRMPPLDDKGRCSWTAPVYAGDKTPLGHVVENGRLYSWRLSTYNAKFRDDDFVSSEPYYLNVQTNHPFYGSQDVAVRYFGPKETYAGKTIRVQAFESPDFTGAPVASGYVAAPDDADCGVSVTGKVVRANATLIGIPKGTYYLRAYIDSNANGVCDSWETMGYLCTRDGTASNILDPVALSFSGSTGAGSLVQIFLEDADTDQDGLPDAWEYATYGSLTKKGVELLSATPAGQYLVNTSLSGVLQKLQNTAEPTIHLTGQALTAVRSAGTVALALGLSAPTTGTFAENISAAIEPELEEDGVSVSSITIDADGNVSLTVDVEAETSTSLSGAFASVVAPKTIDVTCTVYHTSSLAEDWSVLKTQTLTITVGSQTEKISLPAETDATSGFYKVEITK